MSINLYLLSPYPAPDNRRGQVNTNQKDIQALTRHQIDKRASLIEKTIRKQPVKNMLNIAVGCEDFFKSSNLSTNRCMDLDKTYELIGPKGPFAQISAKYKNCLIVPGSLYISVPIPKEHGHHRFRQDGRLHLLSSTTCYTTNIAPVYFQGKLLRIIRKGEMLEQNLNGRQVPMRTTDELSALAASRLNVTSYREDNLTDLFDNDKRGTCYLGKTLLPGEVRAMTRHLQTDDFNKLFSHECTIGDKTFLFVICGEFRGEHSTSGALLNKEQDFIVHMCQGGPISEELRPKSSCYIHVDEGATTQVEVRQPDGNWKILPLEESLDPHNDLRVHTTVL